MRIVIQIVKTMTFVWRRKHVSHEYSDESVVSEGGDRVVEDSEDNAENIHFNDSDEDQRSVSLDDDFEVKDVEEGAADGSSTRVEELSEPSSYAPS